MSTAHIEWEEFVQVEFSPEVSQLIDEITNITELKREEILWALNNGYNLGILDDWTESPLDRYRKLTDRINGNLDHVLDQRNIQIKETWNKLANQDNNALLANLWRVGLAERLVFDIRRELKIRDHDEKSAKTKLDTYLSTPEEEILEAFGTVENFLNSFYWHITSHNKKFEEDRLKTTNGYMQKTEIFLTNLLKNNPKIEQNTNFKQLINWATKKKIAEEFYKYLPFLGVMGRALSPKDKIKMAEGICQYIVRHHDNPYINLWSFKDDIWSFIKYIDQDGNMDPNFTANLLFTRAWCWEENLRRWKMKKTWTDDDEWWVSFTWVADEFQWWW